MEGDTGQNEEYELYIFRPLQMYRHFGGKFSAKFKPSGEKGVLRTEIQTTDLVVRERDLKNVSFAFTFNGEIVVSEEALQILNEENLTGFNTRIIQNKETSSAFDNYFQLVSTHLMPRAANGTKMTVYDNKIFYDRGVLSSVLDFNQSLEALRFMYGGIYLFDGISPQRHWIVSKKARSVLINKLGQNDFDFIPVKLIDEIKEK